MDPNLWNSLKSSQADCRTGLVSGPELALSFQPSISQPAISNAVNMELRALLDRQQRFAAASGLTAGFIPQSAILTQPYGTNASFGGQYATTNSLYQYNMLPVGQPVLTSSYDTCNVLANQQQGLSKNVSLTSSASRYTAPSLTQQLTASNSVIASNVMPSLKVDAVSRTKKPVSYSFVNDQPSRPASSAESNIGQGLRLDGARMNSFQVPSMPSLTQSGFTSGDMTYRRILDSVTSQPSALSIANGFQTTLRPVDSSRLVLAPSDISFDQLSGNLCLDLSQFGKPDNKPYEQNFQAQDFAMLNTESLLSFGQSCELMNAVNMTSHKETLAHPQQAKQHEIVSRGSPLPWLTTAQYCEQQDPSSLSRGIGCSAASIPAVSYEAVSPPSSTETQSFSFVDSLHLYPDAVQSKDLLSSAYDLTDNQIYVKNLFDMSLIYASHAPESDGNSQVSTALIPLSLRAVAPSGDDSGLGKTKHPDMLTNKSSTTIRENTSDRGKRQKNKPTTEVGVVLPMPQNKLSKPLSSNPLIADFESPSSLENHLRQHSAYETVHYGGDSAHTDGRHLLHYYKPDAQQTAMSPDVGSQVKQSSLTAGGGSGRNEIPSDAHNSPIVLTNITGNVYVNQYTMLQPGSMPFINQDVYQPVAHYEPAAKAEQSRTETKSCSVLLIPNEHDDEFGHLSVDPFANQSAACRPADGAGVNHNGLTMPPVQNSSSNLNVLPKAKAVNSAFEKSYVNFVHGHKSETLSSVTNSPIKNKPVLPKYIPELRRPRTDIEKINADTIVSAGGQKSNKSSDSASKASNVKTIMACSNHSVTDSVTAASSLSSFSSANTTKFPAKFSHKLLCKAQLLNDSTESNKAGDKEKERSEAKTEFKWKKTLRADSNERSKSNAVSPKQTPSSQSSDQGSKRKLSTVSETSDGGDPAKPLQVQWTVSKKSKRKKNESADIPILVIKAISSNSKEEKCLQDTSVKSAQSKNSNFVSAKRNAK